MYACMYICMYVYMYVCIPLCCHATSIGIINNKLIFFTYTYIRPLSAISDRPLRSLVRNDLLVPTSRTSTSQQCAFASAGPLLWNCLPLKTPPEILSSSLSSTPRLLKSFLFPRAYRTGGRL